MAFLTDSSNRAHVLTLENGAVMSTTTGKYDNGSIELLSGVGRAVSIPDSDDWYFGTNPFTVELYAKFASVQTDSSLIGQWSNSFVDMPAWALFMNSGSIIFRYYDSTNTVIDTSVIFTPLTGVFYHIAVDRDINNNFRIYIDGAVVASTIHTQGLVNGLSPLKIGTVQGFENTFNFNGNLDNVRITKGIARYAGAFSPLISDYGDSVTDNLFSNVVLLARFKDPNPISTTNVQTSQVIVEVVNQNKPSIQSSQTIVEVINHSISGIGSVSQLAVEVINTKSISSVQTSQVSVEVIRPNIAVMQISQLAVEVIRPNIDGYPSHIMLFG